MVVNHFILIKFKEGTTDQQISDLAAELRGLKDKIPGIISLECGKNFTNRSDFHFGLLVIFTDKQALADYGPHPEHQRVVTQVIAPIKDNVIALDFEPMV